ncbi:PREDICTED: neuronal acetylcholine receptor subunit alpha-7-like, partial [Thamnophis sirtalis]|uniref:Neuronal acetylcholine receptor subunit alpha-7-like n=1 Tax=Thamnophis sirtalis TaxID=35019 RepID=A0A6I9XDG4_9SAUR
MGDPCATQGEKPSKEGEMFSLQQLQLWRKTRYWYDHYLRWNESENPGVKTLRFSADQVWKPDILLYNSANEEFDSTLHTHVLVNSSGYCQWLPPGILKSTCRIDVRWFPFDTQKCNLKFGSWTHDGWLLDLRMLESDTSGYVSNGEWELVGVPGSENRVYYDCCREPYLDVTFVVIMRRRTLYYALNMLVPCLLLSAVTFLVFLLPADSGEKISLGITVLLSLTVFMLLVAEVMPATSDSVPLIGEAGKGGFNSKQRAFLPLPNSGFTCVPSSFLHLQGTEGQVRSRWA